MRPIVQNPTQKVTKCDEILGSIKEETGISLTNCMHTDICEGQARLTAHTRNETISPALLNKINNYEGNMPLTDKMRKMKQVKIEHGKFLNYFSPENEYNYPIIKEEKEWLIKGEGFKIDQAHYFAFPYPSTGDPKGIFFLFIRNKKDAAIIEAHQLRIAELIAAKML